VLSCRVSIPGVFHRVKPYGVVVRLTVIVHPVPFDLDIHKTVEIEAPTEHLVVDVAVLSIVDRNRGMGPSIFEKIRCKSCGNPVQSWAQTVVGLVTEFSSNRPGCNYLEAFRFVRTSAK
jgi:hypothetical protein